MRRFLLACALLLALGLAACGDDENDSAGTTSTPARTATTEPAPAGADAPGEGCTGVQAPEPKGEQDRDAPKTQLAAGKTHVVTFQTNCGSFDVTLDVKRAPRTASSVAALVKAGFYDGLTFHRIAGTPQQPFVIQGGDPLGDGQGGPGYSVVETPPDDLVYTTGVVAMAKTQIEEAGTSGSQFFVVTGQDAGLPPEYALLGKVTKGMDVVERISQVEVDPATEQPSAPVVIQKATLKTS